MQMNDLLLLIKKIWLSNTNWIFLLGKEKNLRQSSILQCAKQFNFLRKSFESS